MRIDFNSLKPIYIQIAEAIEDDILSEKLKAGDACYSQLLLAKELNINPATAAKGISHLVRQAILEKQRGQAMTVTASAKERILSKRKSETLVSSIKELIFEAKKLGISKSELLLKVESLYEGDEEK